MKPMNMTESEVLNKVVEKPEVRRYRPLDVNSWADALRVVVGWLLIPLLAIISGALLYAYEVGACLGSCHVCCACCRWNMDRLV